ncbi:MAG: Trk system potassium transporter TrkA, partial [Alphaproteobacteria bacterium]|nr:Trk system potassium transporter TrkA [Alphaproteobacteria bacterium]
MKVIVLGAGQVGYSIARYLSSEDNDVSVIDNSPDLLKKIGDSMDIQPIVGHASHPNVLEEAGAAHADLMIAVTGSDEVNIVACEVANALFNVKTKIARIRSQNYISPYFAHLFSQKHIAIDHIISPELEIAKSISRSIRVMGAFNVISLIEDKIKCIGIRCTQRAPILNTPLRLLPTSFPNLPMAVLCITRGDKVFIPDGDDQILVGDEVYMLVEAEHLPDITAAYGFSDGDGRRILLTGAGNIGLSLAKELEQQPGIICKVIERSPVYAERAARELQYSEVLCGDGLSFDVLKEANAAATETAVCVTDDDKVNVLAALLAKRQGAKRSMALLNNMSYASFVSSLGIDAIINPKSITVSTILQHIRQGRIRAIYAIRNDFAELIDAEAR